MGVLLKKAAANLGRASDDISAYEARLNEDWYDDVKQLKAMSVTFLARYMRYRLAKKVHKHVQQE